MAAAKIAALLARHPQKVDLSLARIKRLLAALGNPQRHLPPVIHIAGTNGKGSAAAFCRAFLEAAGYSCHVHSSPHLVHWRERYRLGGREGGQIRSGFVSNAELAEVLAQVSAANGRRPITVFEILTAAAFVLFARHPADAVILEVGMGGRFDATNCLESCAAALIMAVGLDHQAFLGETVSQIAAEKAAIIKPGCPAVIGFQPEAAAAAVLARAAAAAAAKLSLYGRDYHAEAAANGGSWRFCAAGRPPLALPMPALAGAFQLRNAAAALKAVQAAGFHIAPAAAAKAMAAVYWPGRLQRLEHGELKTAAPAGAQLWLDGGHNPAAAAALAAALPPYLQDRPFYLICAMLENKDSRGYLRALKSLKPHIIAMPLPGSGHIGRPAAELAALAKAEGLKAEQAAGIKAALAQIKAAMAKQPAGGKAESPFILIGGSLYLAGAALAKNGTPPA